MTSDRAKFKIKERHKLYYLCSNISVSLLAGQSNSLKQWKEIWGHCNIKDTLKLVTIVEGMKITDKTEFECDVCTKGKMTQFQNILS